MSTQRGHTATGGPALTEAEELRGKSRQQKNLKERSGQRDDGPRTHPEARRSGRKGASNVGEDLSSGAELLDPNPDD
jgi:hypothetical protein